MRSVQNVVMTDSLSPIASRLCLQLSRIITLYSVVRFGGYRIHLNTTLPIIKVVLSSVKSLLTLYSTS